MSVNGSGNKGCSPAASEASEPTGSWRWRAAPGPAMAGRFRGSAPDHPGEVERVGAHRGGRHRGVFLADGALERNAFHRQGVKGVDLLPIGPRLDLLHGFRAQAELQGKVVLAQPAGLAKSGELGTGHRA